MKKSTAFKFAVLTLTLVFVTFLFIKGNNFFVKNSDHSIRTAIVKKQNVIQRVTIAGNVVPERKTVINAPFDGYIKNLYVKVGQFVKKGDPIVSIVQTLDSKEDVFPLRAPFAGTVVIILKHIGEFVKRGSASNTSTNFIVRIDSLKNLFIDSYVPEIDIAKMKIGQEAIIKISALLNKSYKGIVKEISLASKQRGNWRSNTKVVFSTKIKILNLDKQIKPGMSAILDIVTLRKNNVLALPHEFILRKADKFYVLPIYGKENEKEKEKEKEIKVGIQNESKFEVLSGIKAGEVVKQVDFINMISKEN